MRRLTILSLSGIALLLGASSSAFAARATVSDPIGPGTPIPGFGVPVTAGFQDCSNFDWTGDGCMGFTNDTGSDIYRLTFTFTVNGQLDGQTLTCATEGDVLTGNTCGEGITLSAGQQVTFSFFGGNPIPGGPPPVPAITWAAGSHANFPGGTLYLSFSDTGAESPEDLPDITAMAVAVPEPGALGVFGLGLALIGLGFGLRRRLQ